MKIQEAVSIFKQYAEVEITEVRGPTKNSYWSILFESLPHREMHPFIGYITYYQNLKSKFALYGAQNTHFHYFPSLEKAIEAYSREVEILIINRERRR